MSAKERTWVWVRECRKISVKVKTVSLPSTGECSVTGDMYFRSFDGRIYTFPATCQYVLAKSRNRGKFTVTIQNAPCGAVSQPQCAWSLLSVSTSHQFFHSSHCSQTVNWLGFQSSAICLSCRSYHNCKCSIFPAVFFVQESHCNWVRVQMTARRKRLNQPWADNEHEKDKRLRAFNLSPL